MDMERALLSKIVTTKDGYTQAVQLGVTLEHLLDDEHRAVWTMLGKHLANHGVSMGRDALRANLPAYKVLDVPEPIGWYIEQVKINRKTTIAAEMVADLADAAEEQDLEELVRVASIGLASISAEDVALTDHDLPAEWRDRIETYREWARDGNTMRGIPTGYHSVDQTTRGLQKGNLIVIAGPPGIGKTTLALSMGRNAHNDGYLIEMVSFEMPADELATRYDSQQAGISHHRLLGGKLTKKEMQRLQRSMAADEERERFILTEDISQLTTVSALQARVQKNRPDALIIDGAYLMQDDNGEPFGSPQALTNISRGLAMLCKTEHLPIIVTTQALLSKMRGSRVTMGSLGYTSAWAQDAHVLLGLSADPDDKEQALLDTIKSRNGPPVSAILEWNWRQARFLEISDDFGEDDGDDDD